MRAHDRAWWHPQDGGQRRSALVMGDPFVMTYRTKDKRGDVIEERAVACQAVDVVWIRHGDRERRTVPAVPCSELSPASASDADWPPELGGVVTREEEPPTPEEPWASGAWKSRTPITPERTDPDSRWAGEDSEVTW